MRITFVIEAADMAGGVRVVAIYAKALAEMGHTVSVVSTPGRPVRTRRKLRSWFKGKGWPADPLPQPSHLDNSGIDHHILNSWRPITDDDVSDADVVIATWWETAEWVNELDQPTKARGNNGYFTYAVLNLDADDLAVRCTDDVAQYAVFPAIGKAMIPTADGTLGVALRLFR